MKGKRIKIPAVTPMSDYVAVIPHEAETTSAVGIDLTQAAKEPAKGIVVAIGSGRMTLEGKRIPMEVEVGDIVSFPKRSGVDQKVDDIEFKLMREIELVSKVGHNSDILTIEVVKANPSTWYHKDRLGEEYETYDDGSASWEVVIDGIPHYIPRANTKVISRVEFREEYSLYRKCRP